MTRRSSFWCRCFCRGGVAGVLDSVAPRSQRRTARGAPPRVAHVLAHQGVANRSIAEQLNLSRPTVVSLRSAFAKTGMAVITGIRRRKRHGKVLTPELEQKILDATVTLAPGTAAPKSSRPRSGLVRRSEKPNPNAGSRGPHPLAARPTGTPASRLQTARHHHVVCRIQHPEWQGDWYLPGSAPQPGVREVSESD